MNTVKYFKLLLVCLGVLLIAAPTYAQPSERAHRKKVKRAQNRRANKINHRHYSRLPRKRAVVRVTPTNSIVIAHRSVQYRFHNGIFYKPYRNQFMIARAPIGVRVRILPETVFRFRWRKRAYFYYYGTYYVKTKTDEYEVVTPENGMLVDALPEGYNSFEIDGKVYYEVDGIYYKEVDDGSEESQYEVVKVEE